MKRIALFAVLLTAAVAFVFLFRDRGPWGDRAKIASLTQNLSHTNEAVRFAAADALREMGSNVAPRFSEQLKARDSVLWSNAVKLIEKTEVLPVPASPAQEERRAAVKGFEALGKAGVPELVKLLDDPAGADHASWLLCQMDDSIIPVLLRGVTNSNLQVRRRTAADLGSRRINAPGVTDALVSLLRSDVDPDTRSMAANALGRIPDLSDAVIVSMIDALNDSSPNTRNSAAQSLGLSGARATNALPALIKLLRTEGFVSTVPRAIARIAPIEAARLGISTNEPTNVFE